MPETVITLNEETTSLGLSQEFGIEYLRKFKVENKRTLVVISFGSNLDPRVERIERSMEIISRYLSGCRCSTIYETPEIHGKGRPYMNAVMTGYLRIDFNEFERLCKQTEIEEGRDEAARMRGDVPIDIDIVIDGDKVIREKDFAMSFFQIGFTQLTQG